MSDEREQQPRSDQEQPGTVAMNPGDEVPPGTPGAGEDLCTECGGSGRLENRPCPVCGGTGRVMTAIGGA